MSMAAGNEEHRNEPTDFDVSLKPDPRLAALLAGASVHPDIITTEDEPAGEAEIVSLPQAVATVSRVLATNFLRSARSEDLDVTETSPRQLEKISAFAFDFLHDRAVATIAARKAILQEGAALAEIGHTQLVTSRVAVLRYIRESYEARRLLPKDAISQSRAQREHDARWALVIAKASNYPELREAIQLHKEMDRRGQPHIKDAIGMLIDAQGARLAHLPSQQSVTIPPNSGSLRKPTL